MDFLLSLTNALCRIKPQASTFMQRESILVTARNMSIYIWFINNAPHMTTCFVISSIFIW